MIGGWQREAVTRHVCGAPNRTASAFSDCSRLGASGSPFRTLGFSGQTHHRKVPVRPASARPCEHLSPSPPLGGGGRQGSERWGSCPGSPGWCQDPARTALAPAWCFRPPPSCRSLPGDRPAAAPSRWRVSERGPQPLPPRCWLGPLGFIYCLVPASPAAAVPCPGPPHRTPRPAHGRRGSPSRLSAVAHKPSGCSGPLGSVGGSSRLHKEALSSGKFEDRLPPPRPSAPVGLSLLPGMAPGSPVGGRPAAVPCHCPVLPSTKLGQNQPACRCKESGQSGGVGAGGVPEAGARGGVGGARASGLSRKRLSSDVPGWPRVAHGALRRPAPCVFLSWSPCAVCCGASSRRRKRPSRFDSSIGIE